MSKVKFSPDLFIESQELNRFQQFIGDDGFRKTLLQDSLEFGLVDVSKNGNFINFLIQQGTNVGTIKINDGIAINKFGNLITKAAADNIAIPSNNQWYWAKIKFQYATTEVGTVSIDNNGNLTGVGTKFLEVLRGQPNIPARVRLQGSVLNTDEYNVQDVTNDTNAILMGDFSAESNLQLVVIGSFTPEAVPASADKEIFQYNDCLTTLILESVAATPPTLLDGEEFVLARIKNNGGVLTIEDKRSLNIYRTKADRAIRSTSVGNALLAVESVRYDDPYETRQNNLVELSWGFRSENWTFNPNINTITINAGVGGKFKTTSDFTNGDFNGWRVYIKGGSDYVIVKSSTKQGTQINLVVDSLNPASLYLNTQIIVVPDSEEIEIIATINSTNIDTVAKLEKRFLYPINKAYVVMPLLVFGNPTAQYKILYRYKNHNWYTEYAPAVNDSVGYLTEASFDALGNLLPLVQQVRTASTGGFITLTLNPNAYSNFVVKIDLGDNLGVAHVSLDNANPLIDLNVGISKQYIVIQGNLVLTTDHYINLNPTGAKNGNKFYLKFENSTTLNNHTLRVVQGFLNPGTPGITLLDFNAFWIAKATTKNVYLECIFDGTNWIVYPDVAVTSDLLNGILNGALLADGTIPASGILKYNGDKSFTVGSNQLPDMKTVESKISTLKGSPPSSLDTLQELAAAIANDPNFATTITNLLSQKVNISDIVDGLSSTATNKPLSANQGRLLQARTNQSVLTAQSSAATDFTQYAPAVTPGYTWPELVVTPSTFGSSAYKYRVFIVTQVVYHSDGGNDDVLFNLQFSTNGGSTWNNLAAITHRSVDGNPMCITLTGFTDITSSTMIRPKATSLIGGSQWYSVNRVIQVVAINTYE